MNQNDINRAFTEKVTDLLSRGYQIYPGTMGGSQGEIAHVDLYKGDEIIRVLLDHSAGRGEKPDGFRLVVGRNTDRIRIPKRFIGRAAQTFDKTSAAVLLAVLSQKHGHAAQQIARHAPRRTIPCKIPGRQ